jgi:putative hemolysin
MTQISLAALIPAAVIAAYLVHLSTAISKLNTAQIERLFELNDNDVLYHGMKVSKILFGLFFVSILSEVVFILLLLNALHLFEWNWPLLVQFALALVGLDVIARLILPSVFPIHVRENLYNWEKWILTACGYVFYIPSVIIESIIIFGRKTFNPGSRFQRLAQAEETIRSIIDAGEKEGVFLNDEGEMLQSIVELSDTVVREVMTPRIDLEAIEISASIDEFVVKVVNTGYSKIPVYIDKVDDIVGILYAKDVLSYWKSNGHEITLDELKRDVTFVPETKKISVLLREFQTEKKHLAIVVDEFGGVAGLVTIEDLLEEIVGEIHDEYDEEAQTIVQLSDYSWEVAARIDLDELSEVINLEFPDANYETLGGFLFHLFERIPSAGESCAYRNYLFKVIKADERKIETVLITEEQMTVRAKNIETVDDREK